MNIIVRAAFCSLLFLVGRVAAGEWAPVAVARSGLVDDGVALFVPAGVDADALPYSPVLLQAPVIRAEIPQAWTRAPKFFSDGAHFRATVAIAADDDLYGTGEVLGPLRRNGQTIQLWNTDNFEYTRTEGRLYQSHPWVLGVRADGSAYGVIFDSTWKAELSCVEAITFTAQGPAFPVVVIERESPLAVLKALADLTGKMPLPPRWALGYQQSRWSYNPDSKVREIADTFRAKKIPCDVIWMDIDYMDGFRVFTFDKAGFPDPAGLNAYLHERGFKTVWMIDPGVKVDSEYSVFRSGTEQDVWVKTAEGRDFQGEVWPGLCVFPDFTRPETRRWWSGLFREFVATGLDGVWNDMNEPAVFGAPDWTMPEDNWHRGGGATPPGPHRRYHNVYGLLMTKATREGILAARPDRRPFVLTRANFLGGQRYAATWTGDNVSNEEHMKLSVPMTLTLGLSGQPFSGPDLGGFAGDATGELWSQWIGVGAFFPFCRGHSIKEAKPKEPWSWGEAVETTARIALERRYRLMPYLYTLFREASETGAPVMRPLFLADPRDRSLREEHSVFMLGDAIAVVPPWASAPRLPRGEWREVSLVPGDRDDASQAKLLLRSGAIVPLGRIVQSTAEESLEPLTLLVCLDENGRAQGQLYEDAGDGFRFRDGDFLLTTYAAETVGKEVRVRIVDTKGKRARPARETIIQVIGPVGTAADFKATGL